MKKDNTMPLFGRKEDEGEKLKEAGIAKVLQATPGDWKEDFESAVRQRMVGGDFIIEEVIAVIGLPPSRNAVGAATSGLAKQGIIECVGFTSAHRASRHGGVVRVWRRGPRG